MMSAAANKTAKKKAGKAAVLQRKKAAAAVMTKFMSKPRKARKAPEDKIIMSKDEKAAFRKLKADQYRKAAEVQRAKKAKRTVKK